MARILVVDDERDVATMLKFMLEKDGHAVETAHDGLQALAALGVEPSDGEKAAPDLVILDVMMPELDGYAVCARMFEDPRTKLVPVVMLTAKGAMRELHAITPNVAAHVDKPFDPRALRDLVAGMLGGKG
ncbi:MAG TPA: response regulator [Elusimicrobiota bacterium]|nr:response regulator [Elusimicrobiota bacterium]